MLDILFIVETNSPSHVLIISVDYDISPLFNSYFFNFKGHVGKYGNPMVGKNLRVLRLTWLCIPYLVRNNLVFNDNLWAVCGFVVCAF